MMMQKFNIQRRIVAGKTSESWKTVPHAIFTTEARVDVLMRILKEAPPEGVRITLNTAMLKVIATALGASPKMNAHLRYSRLFATGKLRIFDHIDASVPVLFADGSMMTVTLPSIESMSMRSIQDAFSDIRRRAGNTNLQEAMYDLALHDTLEGLKHFKIISSLGRLLGAAFGGVRLRTLSRSERKAYRRIPETERLTRRDLEPGTITITNVGSLYREWHGQCALLDILPPQVAAIALGAVRDSILPVTIAFDHRALDAADVMPFIRRLDEILSDEELLRSL